MGIVHSSNGCNICLEKRARNRKFSKSSSSCRHRARCCDGCMESYIKHHHKHGASAIPCPTPGCKCFLDNSVIKRFLHGDQYNSYIARSKDELDVLKKTTKKCPACTRYIEK